MRLPITLAAASFFAVLGAAPMAFAQAASDKHYSLETSIGDLLANPATKAVLEKHVPELVKNEQISMASAMTLKQVQGYRADMVTDKNLADIDKDLAKIPVSDPAKTPASK